MYQELDSPSFTVAHLAGVARGFFEVRSHLNVFEIKNRKMKLVEVQLGGLVVTETPFKSEAGKQLYLDSTGILFWGYFDFQREELTVSDSCCT